MAQKNPTITTRYREKVRRKRRGVHAKTKSSRAKTSDNYRKPYVGQGK